MNLSEQIRELRGEGSELEISNTAEANSIGGEGLPTPPDTPPCGPCDPDYAFPISSEEIFDYNAIKIPEYQLIRRLDTQDILTINSQRYSIKTHREVVETAETAMEEFEELKNPEKRVCLIRNGARLLILYTFPNIKMDIDEGDPISLQLILNNSYDRTCRLGMTLGAWRNKTRYFITGKEFETFRKKHYESLSLVEMKKQIQTSIEKWALLEKTLTNWSTTALPTAAGVAFLKKAKLPEKYEEAILAKWEVATIPTKFKLYNIGCVVIRELSESEERKEVLGTNFVKVLFR